MNMFLNSNNDLFIISFFYYIHYSVKELHSKRGLEYTPFFYFPCNAFCYNSWWHRFS